MATEPPSGSDTGPADPPAEQNRAAPDPIDPGQASDTSRLETFADGVMAIAITLLILLVAVPSHVRGPGNLSRALGEQWPSYAGYAVSFLTIGVIWVNHHHMFKLIERTNHGFLMMNVVFLMTIAFLPWPTALVATYVHDPDGRTVATVVYGLTMVSIAIMFNVVWRYASGRGRLLSSGVDPQAIARSRRDYLIGPIVYSIATLLALWDPYVSLAIFAALAVYWLLPGTGPRA
jgi:uncharacterized membrane protein